MLKKQPIVSKISSFEHLVELCGVSRFYQDYSGKYQTMSIIQQKMALQAMGFDVSSKQAIEKAERDCVEQLWKLGLSPISLVHQGQILQVLYRIREMDLSLLAQTEKLLCSGKVILETGDQIKFSFRIDHLEIKRKHKNSEGQIFQLGIVLPQYLPIGYHKLEISIINVEKCSLVVVPATCYEPKELKLGKKIWGVSVQLYGIRSERNWGMGDYTDLKFLVRKLAENGAHWVSLNPLHQLYLSNPEHCSPYSPSSRLLFNVLYIDPMALPEWEVCAEVKAIVTESSFQEKIKKVRAQDNVDYINVSTLKVRVLEVLYKHFCAQHLRKKSMRGKQFLKFCENYGKKLDQIALYDVIYEYFFKKDSNSWGWPCWPGAYRNPESIEVKHFANIHRERITYYKYLQWLAHEQFSEVQVQASQAGMIIGVCNDLAVGADYGGAEVWSYRSHFCFGVSVGAPPDALASQGQNWGLPPINPKILKEQEYEFFINMIRRNMIQSGALRVDHVMGLFRQWWCPNKENGALHGVYVHYPFEDLLGIIKLESHRNRCLVFGEDLGIVPDEVRQGMSSATCYSNILSIFMERENGFVLPEDYKCKSMATLVSHDTPTLSGWWVGKDIDIAESLGLMTSSHIEKSRSARLQSREKIIKLLEKIGELPSDTGMEVPVYLTRQLMERLSYFLMFTEAQITSIQLEDCLLMEMPVNVPGTSVEYPNWRRKLSEDIESIFENSKNTRFFYNLTQCRQVSRGNS